MADFMRIDAVGASKAYAPKDFRLFHFKDLNLMSMAPVRKVQRLHLRNDKGVEAIICGNKTIK